jgi:putative GTP pyrophosphokinase
MATRAQIDKLGERLKAGPIVEVDLRLLDEYRLGFADAYVAIVSLVAQQGVQPSGREAKSRSAIVEKLRRESIRLSQIQDIAGCRVVVPGRGAQDSVARRLASVLDCTLIDRRLAHSHGYRAVHLIARHEDLPVEVQIRTAWQHHWAETSEKLSDEIDPGIKYGQGPPDLQALMMQWSDAIERWENWLASRGTVGKVTLMEQTLAEREHREVLAARYRVVELLARLPATRRENGP